jgi:hypothetical protein
VRTMRPSGPSLGARLTRGGPTGAEAVIAMTSAGVAVTIEAEIFGAPRTRVLETRLVVARPGSIVGVAHPSKAPPDWAIRPENQVVASDPIVGGVVPDGQRLAVTFRPTEPGTYPVFHMSECTVADDDPSHVWHGMGTLGQVIVR